jgi:hypothetical protein
VVSLVVEIEQAMKRVEELKKIMDMESRKHGWDLEVKQDEKTRSERMAQLRT